jgi:hypothetical protein
MNLVDEIVPQNLTRVERVKFRGHPMVTARHPTTLEITTDTHLTKNGDCIIGVGADKACAQLDRGVREWIQDGSSQISFRVIVGQDTFTVRARGDARLTLADPHEMVIRRSDFVSGRTVGVKADSAAIDLPRQMVARLKRPETLGCLEIEVRGNEVL